MDGLKCILSLSSRSLTLCFLVFPLVTWSCVYEFVLGSRKNYGRYETLYVERSLNPSGSLLDGEILEDEVQKKLIQNFPDIRLSSKDEARLYVRLTYRKLKAELRALESSSKVNAADLSSNSYRKEDGELMAPHQLEKLKRGTHGYLRGSLKVGVFVEVWDVRKRGVLFSKFYASSKIYHAFFHPRVRLLELDLRERSTLRKASGDLATRLMGDLAHIL